MVYGQKFTLVKMEREIIGESKQELRKLTFNRMAYRDGDFKPGEPYFGEKEFTLHLSRCEDWEKYELGREYLLGLQSHVATGSSEDRG
jgi:hypothetical protein